jgi:uncharacterized protein (DUF433 family)
MEFSIANDGAQFLLVSRTPIAYHTAMKRVADVRHPYIHRRKGVCGGEPVIRGTRFPVRSVVVYVLRMGMTPEEMVRKWDILTLAQIYDALSYYHDHRKEIDRLIAENQESIAQRKYKIGG